MKKILMVSVLAGFVFAVVFSGALYAADTKIPAKADLKGQTARPVVKPNFGMIAGTIMSMDSADPANIKLEIKNDSDGSVHTAYVTQWTNITKVTDASELKTGEPIRMMTRKVDNKDMAMGIMFGKIKNIPPPQRKLPDSEPAIPVKIKK